MAAKLLPGLVGVAMTAVLTRLLDPSDYGLYGLALALMALGSGTLFDWLGISFLRFHRSRQEQPALISTFLVIFIALVAVSAAAFAAAWTFGLVPADLVGIYVVGLILVWACSWFELVSKLSVAELQPGSYLRMHLGRSLASLIGTTAGAWLTGSPLWSAMGNVAGLIAGAFSGTLTIGRPSLRRFDARLAREVLAFGVPIAAAMMLASAMIDNGMRIVLERLDSAEALGLYTAAAALAQSASGVMAAGVHFAGYSLAVRELENADISAVRKQLLANGTLLLAVIAPTSLGVALTAHCLATTIVGAKFTSGLAEIMPWMAAGTFFASMGAYYFDTAFQLGRRPHLQIWVNGFAGVVAIGLSLYLIPRQGAIGAAIAVAVARAISCIHAIIAGRYAFPVPLPIAGGVRVGICCAVMIVAVVGLPDSGWTGLILRSVFGCLAYVLTAIAVNLLNARDHAAHLVKRVAEWQAASS